MSAMRIERKWLSKKEVSIICRSQKMKPLASILITLLAVQTVPAEDGPDDWMTFYYKNPTPQEFAKQVRIMTDAGKLKDTNAQNPIMSFLSVIMAQNPDQISAWLTEFEDLDKQQRNALLAAAWYSNTEAARDYFKRHDLQAYLQRNAPKILEMEVNSAAKLDMLWGQFLATGDAEPIRRIISAFRLSKYSGALKRYKTSEKTEQDKKEAYWDVTYQAAMWSLESNCQQHPRVLEHCEMIFADPELPKAERLWLGLVLTKVKPEKYSIETGAGKLEQGTAPTP